MCTWDAPDCKASDRMMQRRLLNVTNVKDILAVNGNTEEEGG